MVICVECHSSVQFSSVTQSCLTLCNPMNRSTPGIAVHHQLLEFTQTHVHQVRDAIQPSHPRFPFSSCPQPLPASVFSNESTLRIRWPKYWSFSFSIIPSKEIPGLISFRMDGLDLLAVQGRELNSCCHWGCIPSGGTRGESAPSLAQLLKAARISWLRAASL